MTYSDHPVKRTPEEFVHALTAAVTDRLISFGLDVETEDAETIITKWATQVTRDKALDRSAILYADDTQLDNIAESLVIQLLSEIAEERPGTDPWEHEPTIPIPMPILLMQNTYLTLSANLALHNNATKWVKHAHVSVAAITDAILDQVTRETPPVVEQEVLFHGELRPVYGQTVMVPQPALAYLARFYENVLFHIERGLWKLEDETDEEERSSTIATLTSQAALLRNLNERYGRPTGPRHNS